MLLWFCSLKQLLNYPVEMARQITLIDHGKPLLFGNDMFSSKVYHFYVCLYIIAGLEILKSKI